MLEIKIFFSRFLGKLKSSSRFYYKSLVSFLRQTDDLSEDQKKRRQLIFLLLIIFILLGATIGSYFLYPYYKQKPTRPHYSQVYTLVSDKISKSAPIRINLPDGVDKLTAQQNTTFYPKVKGEWLVSDEEQVIIFQPKEDLEVGKYYAVELTMGETNLRHEFLVDENPQVAALFPKENSETHENSEITIIFNRPMVPLTTLDVLEEKDIPVEIIPETQGRFKWISTRNLQFIPEERLFRSSNYAINIKSDITSMDGLNIGSVDHHFVTRKLRYNYLSHGSTIYRQPIAISFNQEVDLERTIPEISVTNTTFDQTVEFIAEYPTRKVYNEEKEEYEERPDKTRIQIYNKADQFGRQKFWDFTNNYHLKINKAYPTEGDIILDESRESDIQVTDVVSGTFATSDRSNQVSLNYFDPQGKLWISFYEEIDLARSKITADHLKNIDYGEKCRELEEGEEISTDVECEKVPDKQRIYLDFNQENIGHSQTLAVHLDKIYNVEELKLNAEPIIIDALTFPDLQITKTVPANNQSGASLNELAICSSNPLITPDKELIDDYLKTNLDYQFNIWYSSRRITYAHENEPCAVGEFYTNIYYGLMPESNYEIQLFLEDHFGQKLEHVINFRTGKMPEHNLNFYHYQKRYNLTTPEKTKLTYAVENMEYVNLHICKLAAEKMLYYLEERPDYDQEPGKVSDCTKIAEDKIELPARYWIKNYFQIDLKDYVDDPLGHYILTFSHPDYRQTWGEKKNVYERTYLSISNLAVLEKKIQRRYEDEERYQDKKLSDETLARLQNLYWVTDISSLENIEGARVELYQGFYEDDTFKMPLVHSYITDEQGIVRTETVNDLQGAVVKKGDDTALVTYETNDLKSASTAWRAEKIYLYTDRPIYRPTHEIFIKGLHRIGYDGNYEIFQEKKIELKVYNSQQEEIHTEKLTPNEFGTFNTKIILAQDAALGRYRVCADDSNCVYFDVEEYVPAPFKIEATSSQEEYISGDTINININADYYFGAPLEGGEVEYSVASQNYYFDKYTDEYFSFGSGWYRCWSNCQYGDKFLLRKKVELSDSGEATISEKIDFNTLFKEADERESKIFVVYITVKNSNGEVVSTQKSFIVHAGEFYLGLKPNKSFLAKDETFNLKAKSVDTEGREAKQKNLNLEINKVTWARYKRKGVDGAYYYRWEEQKEKVVQETISTDKNGDFAEDYFLEQAGRYEITLSGTDKRGNTITSSYSLYVHGEGSKQIDVRPSNDTTLELTAENTSLNVGDTAQVIIQSPYPKAKALVSIERGRIFSYEIIDIENNLYNYSFDISEDYVPNVYFSVFLISDMPEVKFGQVSFYINREYEELDIEVQPDKSHYLPGEEVILNVEVKDINNQPVEAELSVAVVDLSVLALKGNPQKNPLIFFYNGFPLTVATSSNVKNILYEVDVPTGTKGGGGGDPDELAKKKRGLFKDTAFWEAVVRTDAEGKATVKFVLPDNLTTWQVESLGITEDTKLGIDYREFISRKELMVVPLKPRFIVPGDTFYIGAKVFNQTNQKQTLKIKFTSETLTLLEEDIEKKIKLSSEETETIYFAVQAPSEMEDGLHVFTLSAFNEDYEDTVENTIPITPNETYEATATANYTSDDIAKEYVFLPGNIIQNKGELTTKASATLAVFLSEAMEDMLKYPYGSAEQIASKINTIATVQKAHRVENLGDKITLPEIEYKGQKYSLEEIVEIGLANLYNKQENDGGFSYYRSGKSNFYLTLHVVNTLVNLREAGFVINDSVLKKATDYLTKQIKWGEKYNNKNLVILTAYALNRALDYSPLGLPLQDKILEITKDEAFIRENISNNSLAHLAMLLTYGYSSEEAKDKIYDQLENRIDIDARGAYLGTNHNLIWQYYETPIKNTALLVKALAKDERDNKILDKVLRWLLASRDKKGAWGSTNNIATVIDAMTDYLIWQRETESEFDLQFFLNDEEKGSYSFNKETILDEFIKVTPLNELEFNFNNTVKFIRTNYNELKNNFYYDMSLKYFLPIEEIPPQDEGFTITREFYALDDKENKNPLQETSTGEVLRGHLTIYVTQNRNFVSIEDFIPAGMEIIDLDFATSDRSLDEFYQSEIQERKFRPDFEEDHDDRIFLFKERVYQGIYEFDYFVRALVPGKFHHLPAVASEMYFLENFGRTRGDFFEIKE